MKKLLCLIFILTLLATAVYAQDFSSQFERSHTLFKWGYYDDAIIQLNKIINTRKEPAVARAKFLKAICYLKKKETIKATNIFQKLVDSKYILTDYTIYFMGNYYMDEGNFDTAKDHFALLSKSFPNSALARTAKLKEAECLYKLKDFKGASRIYEGYMHSYPADEKMDEAIFNLGKCREKIGNMKGAFHAYDRIKHHYPLSKYLKKANQRIRYLSKHYKFRSKRETAQTRFDKAMAFYNKKDYKAASYYLWQVVKYNRKSKLFDEALFKLAFCDYRLRRFKTATTRFRICVNRGGKFADDAQFYMAFCYGKRGYFYKALNSLKNVISKYKDSPYKDDAVYYLGYYYDVNNFKDSAVKRFEELAIKFPESIYIDDALWRAGQIHYFKGRLDKALSAFDRVATEHPASTMADECAYWKALTLEKMGKRVESVIAYKYVIERFDHTYYSHRARKKLNALGVNISELEDDKIKIADLAFGKEFFEAPPHRVDLSGKIEPYPMEEPFEENQAETAKTDPKHFAVIDLKKHFKKYTELMSMNLFNEAEMEARWVLEGSPRDKKGSAKLAISAALLGAGKYRQSIMFAEGMCNEAVANGRSREIPTISWRLSYPKGYYKHVKKYSEKYGLDPYLVLAVIREESRFNPVTLSWARAHGLMQIIPPTGRDIARSLRIRPFYYRRMYEPELNIKMGCWYLSRLIKKFNGNTMMALAGYNGGPRNVSRWMSRWKRKYGSDINTDEFAESIPLKETRRYVQKVLKSYNEYKRIYKERSISLTDFIYHHD
ncbi:transglycosylase SLT domain-containing protein [Candidatus Margulisiibacteriota bacterium]